MRYTFKPYILLEASKCVSSQSRFFPEGFSRIDSKRTKEKGIIASLQSVICLSPKVGKMNV